MAMIEQDYIMRMINMMVAMLARLIRHKNKKEFPQALLEIETTGRTLLGIDRDFIRSLSPAQLMELFGSDLSVALPKLYILALLLKEEADVRALMGEETDPLRVKSLCLLIDTLLKGGEPVESRHTQIIEELIGTFHNRALPADTLNRLIQYYEHTGRFDRAENVLYDLLEADPDYAGEGVLFYRRLLQRSDAELEAGRLPRNEVADGLAWLQERHYPDGRGHISTVT